MQIIIPMSGFGERFRRAGFNTPKPLININDKPIIAHVIDLFRGEHNFIFILSFLFEKKLCFLYAKYTFITNE